MLYLAVKFDSSHLCEVCVTSGKDETGSFMGEFPFPFSYWNLSRWEGRQISLHFSSGENSSGPWAILAEFCSYSFQSIHTCLCVTSLSLLECNPKCWWHGSVGRNSRRCASWRERAGDGHQLWQAALPVLAQSNDLTFPSSSATLPLEAGKWIFLVLFALLKCISHMKMWGRFLSSTYGQLSKTHSQRALLIKKAIRDDCLLKKLHPVSRNTLVKPSHSTFNFLKLRSVTGHSKWVFLYPYTVTAHEEIIQTLKHKNQLCHPALVNSMEQTQHPGHVTHIKMTETRFQALH